MWEMQALTSTPSLSQSGDGHSPNQGGITDMDTSNDEKSESELCSMDCTLPHKNDNHQNNSNSNLRSDGQQSVHGLLPQQSHGTATNGSVIMSTASNDSTNSSSKSNLIRINLQYLLFFSTFYSNGSSLTSPVECYGHYWNSP